MIKNILEFQGLFDNFYKMQNDVEMPEISFQNTNLKDMWSDLREK